jgi:predicted ATPase
MLEKDREQRIPSVRLVGAELEAIATGRAAVPVTPDTPPPARLAGQRHNLPAQPIPFVGRQAELAELNRLLVNPSVRLITVAGAGGMGKTRLALEAAALHLDHFADGVYLVSLAPVPSPDGMVAAIGEAAGLAFSQADPYHQILDYLRAKSLLLILDNFEHVMDGAPVVADLLAEAPGLKIVVASRAKLDLQGEHLFHLAGMDLPASAASTAANLDNAAIHLFLQGARRVRPGYEPNAADLEQIVRICRLVEGMPLGILLAAAWLEMLSPAEIAAEIARSYDFLETGLRDLPERQRSMRAVFEYSWNLLTDREREIFQGLSAFCCSFARDAAQQVTGATLRELMALTTKSLLYRTPDGRYEGHGMVQQYAAAKLDASPDGGRAVRDRYAAYYLDLLSGWEADLHGPRQQEALAAIDAEADNIRTAWVLAAERGQAERLSPAMDSLGHFYTWRGRYAEGEVSFRLAAGRLAQLGQALPVRLLAKALSWQSLFCRALGQHEMDRQRGQQALTLLEGMAATEQGDDVRSEKAFAHIQVGEGLTRSGDHRGARRHYGQSLVLYQALGDAEGTAEALFGLGWVAARLSQFDEARRLCEESLSIYRSRGDLRGVAAALGLLGTLALDQGQSEEAVRFVEESVAIRRQIGDRPEIAAALADWGRMLNYTGEFAASYDQYHEALAIYQDLGTRTQVAGVYSYLANNQSHQGNYDQARSLGQTALALAREVGDQGIIAYTLFAVGGGMLAAGDPAEARRLLEEGLSLYRSAGQKAPLASCMGMLGGARHRLGDVAEARPLLRDALRIAVEVKAFVPKLVSLALAAWLLAEQGQAEEAAELWALLSGYPFVAQSHWFADVAGRQIAAAAATLPPDAAAAAQLLGHTRDLDSTASEVADELDRQIAAAAATWTPPSRRVLRGEA